MSQIAVQQQALGRLQVGLVDEMEAKGSFNDPETQKIMDKYHKVKSSNILSLCRMTVTIHASENQFTWKNVIPLASLTALEPVVISISVICFYTEQVRFVNVFAFTFL